MSWSYRMMATEYDNGEIELGIHEVYYDGAGNPEKYSEKPIPAVVEGIEGKESLVIVLEQMLASKFDSILWTGERFPEKYIEK